MDFIDPIPKFYFSWSNKILFSQTESRGDESIVSFSFFFFLGKCAGKFEFMGQEFPEVFLGLQKFAKYYMCISCLFHLLTSTL